MTGYEEILTDPSYAAQIVTFTFPHIGVVGVNDEDIEVVNAAAALRRGRARSSAPTDSDAVELSRQGPARRLAEVARRHWPHRRRHPRADDAHPQVTACRTPSSPMRPTAPSTSTRCGPQAARWPGIDGMDLVPAVGATQRYRLGRDELDARERLRPVGSRRASMSWRSTTASSATSCVFSTTAAAR